MKLLRTLVLIYFNMAAHGNSNILEDLGLVINNHVKNILEDIAMTYDLDIGALKNKYLLSEADACCRGVSGGVVAEKKKRGRKKKQKDEFIETEEYEYEGVKYLVDRNNNVYTHNVEEPHLVGERLVDGTVRLFEESRDE